ncbi:TPA: acyltransferase family protein [Enterococcus faecium]|nr:acyltransferase family protein [Enterococcus faecium]
MYYFQQSYLPAILKKAISIGDTGVHIFFFCSGFGLYLSYLKKPITLGEFLQKRFIKIYIPYIIVITVSVLLPYMTQDLNAAKVYLSHVLLFKIFLPVYEESLGPFGLFRQLFSSISYSYQL